MTIDYNQKIPNNVDLASNRTLQRALEHWQPEFVKWWGDMGPAARQNCRERPEYAKARSETRDSTWTYSEGRARTRQSNRAAQAILIW